LAEVMAAVADDVGGVKVTSRCVVGPAAATLIDASQHADLLVVGRRGHGGFVSLVMGSVAQQVAAHAHCPVVIVAGE
jgi:nucleotide-binding universal stress UspA family protein